MTPQKFKVERLADHRLLMRGAFADQVPDYTTSPVAMPMRTSSGSAAVLSAFASAIGVGASLAMELRRRSR
jgi:hypothetical protein